VRKGFLRRVARFAVPSGTIIAAAVFTVYEIARRNHDLTLDQRRTAAALALVGVALIVLIRIARPLTAWRLALVAVMCAGFVLALALPPAQDFFQLELPAWGERLAAAIAIAVAIPALVLGDAIAKRIIERVTPEHAA
jgi:cation-transporting ATPase E